MSLCLSSTLSSLDARSLRCIPPRAARSAGFTLIEVLVAILVLSFGMLGVVGLQLAAMQANKEARYQSSAVRYARELAEMMRANRTVLALPTGPYLSINYAVSSNTAPPAYPSTGGCPASCATTLVSTPTPHIDHTDIASYDVALWWARAAAELPGLRVVVCPDSAPYDAGNKAQWACTAPASTAAGQGIYIKMGWSQQSTNRAANGVTNAAVITATGMGIPLVVIPVVN